MQPQDKISKSSWTLLEVVKDTVSINVTNALRSGQLKIEAAQIEKLLTIIAASADEGYHRGHKSFMKTVESGGRHYANSTEHAASGFANEDPKFSAQMVERRLRRMKTVEASLAETAADAKAAPAAKKK